jgi:hypothetical protein
LYFEAKFIVNVLASAAPGTNVPNVAGSVDTAFENLKFVVAAGTFMRYVGLVVDNELVEPCPPRC